MDSRSRTACKVLGVPLGATEREIKVAFRDGALRCHPDLCRNPDDEKHAEQRFKELEAAYAHLLGRPGRTFAGVASTEQHDASRSRRRQQSGWNGPFFIAVAVVLPLLVVLRDILACVQDEAMLAAG
eukprot:CAMPEP_0169269026 /NCGR_PEP_ID=MMETSP1016-20121227/48180_1 /TAXON_ID=342587 /ORGANISM="Karlodinium micrum, Strain CCMP2283" /LENGTH=126 /DNA_ID=CAMNT_0009353909 /DNA_START=185 /DNA_END=561 /DNA_ORIENTATION=-